MVQIQFRFPCYPSLDEAIASFIHTNQVPMAAA
jgi:hypothetical protein